MKRIISTLRTTALLAPMLTFPALSHAAVMNDYCIVPAFIQQAIPANLLMMIDNSSSMYDLEYADRGYTNNSGTLLRQPMYCYDETYHTPVCSVDNTRSCWADTDCATGETCQFYGGYFDKGSGFYYSYDSTNKYFVRTSGSFPASTGCTYYIPNALCLTPDSTGVIGTAGSTFIVSGNYLNWLTASKFDVEKGILTGGKMVTKLCRNASGFTDQSCNIDSECASFGATATCTAITTSNFIQPESRGCVGQPFIKTPLSQDFVNFVSTYCSVHTGTTCQSDADCPSGETCVEPNTANKLGITFAVRGPVDSANKSNPSRGGQTYIDVYQGTYNNLVCQKAVTDYYTSTVNQSTVGNDIQACLNYVPTSGTNRNYCSRSTSTSCTTDNDCITGTHGGCANGAYNAISCYQDTDCSSHITTNGTCTNKTNGGASISCQSDTACAAGTITAGGTCSNNSSVSCTTDSQCGVKTAGTCAGGSHKSCTTNDQNNSTGCTGQTGPCNGIVYYACTGRDPASSGTCTNPRPVYTSYVCDNPAPATVNNGPCVNPTQNGAVNTKIALSETIQTCWTYLSRNQAIGTGDYNRLIGGSKCDAVYASWGVCSGNNSAACSSDANCTGSTGPCLHGPGSILPGNPAMVCSSDYLGKYCTWTGQGTSTTWTGTTTTCTWNTSNPTAIEDDYANFCKAQQPTVIDPTDSAASTTNYEQLPALIGGMGTEGQLGTPIGSIPVRLKISDGTQPSGLIQQFGNQIRIGAMSFNFNGSSYESRHCSNDLTRSCTANSDCTGGGTCGAIAIPRVCSNNTKRLCAIDADCPPINSGNYCMTAANSAPYNNDGAQVIAPIGQGKCATMVSPTQTCAVNNDCPTGNTCLNGFCGAKNATDCTTDINCSTGDTCISNGVGDHTTGLVNSIDSIRANAWTPFAEAFYDAIGYFARVPNSGGSTPPFVSRTDMRLNTGDFKAPDNPSQYRCQQNYVLLITDGSSTADLNPAIPTLASGYSSAALVPPGYSSAPPNWNSACTYYAGSSYLPILAYAAQNRNIADFTQAPLNGRDKISTFVVYNGLGDNGQSGECNSKSMLSDTAKNGGTKQLYQASDPETLNASLSTIFQQIAAQSASGTAASILSNSAGSGANILQALFYPERQFGNKTVNWIGEMLNLWYYVDPFINNSTVREDTGYTSGDHTLDLVNNYVISFAFDSNPVDTTTYNQAVVKKYQGNPDGTVGAQIFTGADVASQGYFSTDHFQAIWRAGAQLQATSADSRHIYTPCLTAGCSGLINFSTTNDTTLQGPLQASSSDVDNIINWVRGSDATPSYRQRTVTYTYRGTTTNDAWKLGDIISSTPRTQSSVKLNVYDLGAPAGYNDGSYSAFVSTDSNHYASRGMAYVGANDGMLHAFKLGTLDVASSGTRKATLSGETSAKPLGTEEWAFIPTNALPYLRYLTCTANGSDPYCNSQNYGHLYFIDGSTTVVDVSIGNPSGCSGSYYNCAKDFTSGTNWRTVLLGGMGVGGASKLSSDATCYEGKLGPDGTTPGTCVKSPVSNSGYSSYFALDVTNQTFDSGNPGAPTFMWEFSDPSGLGFASTGPAVVRVSARDGGGGLTGTPIKNNNGRWFAVFGSGPTGPIDKTRHQFLGRSDQTLKIYVVDLNATMPWTLNSNYWVIDHLTDNSQLANAFVSSMSGAPIDTDRWNTSSAGNYQDNALYFGYVQANTSSIDATTTWTNGGVLRLVTNEDPNPAHWKLSPVITLSEPVTTGIAKLQDRGKQKLWLYFGTGRYYYGQDDMSNPRHLYGIKEPCYTSANTLDMGCTTSINAVDPTSSYANLANQTDVNNPGDPTNKNGWFISLDGPAGTSGAERSITDAVALTNGAVFYSTYKPTSDLCAMGGNSFLWAVKYDTGLQPPSAALKGQVLFQLSTGEFKQVSLSNAGTFGDGGGRKSGDNWTGKPPSDPPPIVSTTNLKPVKKILHIQEQ